MRIGERLRVLREKKNLTLEEVEILCGLKRDTVVGLESFSRWLSLVESLRRPAIVSLINVIPNGWFDNDREEFGQLLDELEHRRSELRPMLRNFLEIHSETTFPNYRAQRSLGLSAAVN